MELISKLGVKERLVIKVEKVEGEEEAKKKEDESKGDSSKDKQTQLEEQNER